MTGSNAMSLFLGGRTLVAEGPEGDRTLVAEEVPLIPEGAINDFISFIKDNAVR